jgi:predicted component of type VI protein secretion system
MTERERAEAEEAARVASMSDSDVAESIRRHLSRVFIGRDIETREITKDDGTPGTIQVRKPHRFVAFFDELVRGYGVGL